MTAVALMLAVCTSAQFTPVQSDFKPFTFIPKGLAYGDDLQITSIGAGEVNIYDSNFNLTKTIAQSLPLVKSNYTVYKRRADIVSLDNQKETSINIFKNSDDLEPAQNSMTADELWECAKMIAARIFRSSDSDLFYTSYFVDQLTTASSDYPQTYLKVDESTHTIYYNDETSTSSYSKSETYYLYDTEGTKYPVKYFVFSPTDKSLKFVQNQYSHSYTGNWEETTTEYAITTYVSSAFYNLDEGNSEGVRFELSQTLFNSDQKYEYLVPICEYHAGEPNERDRDGNGEVDEISTTYFNYITGVKIMSEDGNELDHINFETYSRNYSAYVHVYKIGNKYYLANLTDTKMGKDSERYEIFLIDSSTSSVKRMENVQLAIRPNVVDRSSMVTVELDDTDTARELVVTGMDGRIVERRDIPAGERQIQVPAARMASGMYNFTIRKRGTVEKNGKVIVK